MQEWEIDEWVTRLGINRQERIRVLKDLLHHAPYDGMSRHDRELCTTVLKHLENDERKAKGLPSLEERQQAIQAAKASVQASRKRWPGSEGLKPKPVVDMPVQPSEAIEGPSTPC